MRRVLIVLLATVLCAPLATVNAGVFLLTPVVTGAFDPVTFDELPSTPNPDSYFGGPIIWEITVVMDVVGLAPGERSFANTGFNIVFGPEAEDAYDAGWQPDHRLGDSNGSTSGGTVPLWFANTDAGTPGDEKGILVSIAGGLTGTNDNRRNIGQDPGSQGPVTGANPYPTGELGTFFVLVSGNYGSYIELTDILFQSADVNGIFGNTVTGESSRLALSGADADPEPSSFVLAMLGAMAAIARRQTA